MKLHVLGIDLGKTVFHLVGLDSTGRVVIRKRCSRTQLLAFTANLQVQLIGMEACSGAHFLGRALREQGHEVPLMPAQYVKPYVQTNMTLPWKLCSPIPYSCELFYREMKGPLFPPSENCARSRFRLAAVMMVRPRRKKSEHRRFSIRMAYATRYGACPRN